MAKITEKHRLAQGHPLFLCDFSPPRGADLSPIEEVSQVGADFICVAYAPGKSVRVDSAIMAYELKRRTGNDVVFNLACRDMNKLAIQSHLLGAAALDLENVLIVRGDPFSEQELSSVKEVGDYTTTQLIASVKAMNGGLDYRGLKLTSPTSFCIGATLDLGRELEREARLAGQKREAGARFFITQSLFHVDLVDRFMETYERVNGSPLAAPVFYGLQVLDKDGIFFGDVPAKTREELERGRPGIDIALELLSRFTTRGVDTFYLIPPIMRGGIRKYDVAQQLVEMAKKAQVG